MKQIVALLFLLIITFSAFAQLNNKIDLLKVNDLTTKKFKVESTTEGAIPCPKMTQVQRDAIVSPLEGQCIYNSTAQTLNIYDGDAWVEVAGGGEGGIARWETAKFYEVDDVVVSGNDIYICIVEHTSGVSFDPSKFQILAQDLGSVTGVLSMTNGGTNKALTPELGGLVYTDSASMEVLGAGASGKFLKSNGAAAPSWEDVPATEVSDSTFSGVLSLGKGGTSKSLTSSNGAIAYSDADSLELLPPGSSGQILQSNGVGAPSFVNKSISAKPENGSSVTIEEIQVSNNQLTQTDTNKHLVESGNKNILSNPSFEHSTFSTGWTNSAGTFSAETTAQIHGKKAAKLVLSSETMALIQDSTLYAAQFADGVQGLVSVMVKSDVALKVCSRQAGVTSTSNCVDVQANNKWGLYKVPMILRATSNGIAIVSSGNVSGTVYIDDAFVGAVDLKQDVDQSRIAGYAFFAGTSSCLWTRTSTMVGAFSTTAACPGPTVPYSSMGSWQTTDSDLPRVTVNNLPAGVYEATFIIQQYNGAITTPSFAINDGTTTCQSQGGTEAAVGGSTSVTCVFSYTSSGNRVFELYGASATSTITVRNDNSTSGGINSKFVLKYFGSGSVYSANCGANCVDVFSAEIAAAGTVSNENIDWINGSCAKSGTSNQTGTCTLNITLSSELNCTCSPHSSSGTTNDNTCQISTSNSSTQLIYFSTANGTASSQDIKVICQKQGADFTASRTIVGSFNEVVTTPGISKPKTCSFGFGGASYRTSCTASPCTVYNANGCSPTVTRSSASNYVVTFPANTWSGATYNCTYGVATYISGTTPPGIYETADKTATTLTIQAIGSTSTDAAITLNCHGTQP